MSLFPVTRVFLHSPSEAPDARTVATWMPELEGLGERALLLARPGDVVCLAQAVDPGYLEFLHSLSVGPRPEDVIVVSGVTPGTGVSERFLSESSWLDELTERLGGHGTVHLSPFFATPSCETLAGVLGTRLGRPARVLGGPAGLARRLHDKRVARRLARRLGIPVAPGETVRVRTPGSGRIDEAGLRRSLLRWSRETGAVIVRGASGASGSSTFTADASGFESAIHEIAARTDNASYLVQPFYDLAVSPNVEVAMDPGTGAVRAAATDQVMDEKLVYLGSAHPTHAGQRSGMLAAARTIAGWMQQRGFAGHAGFDYVERPAGSGDPAWFLTEINPRINGATYPVSLLERLARRAELRGAPPPLAFRTGGMRVEAAGFQELARLCGGLLYDLDRGEGVVPYALPSLVFGKVGIAAFAGTRQQAEEIFDDLASRLDPCQGAVLRR